MKNIFLATGFGVSLLFGGAAFAQSADNIKISYSSDADKSFKDNYGDEEKAVIEQMVREKIGKHLGSDVYVEIEIDSATPNRPTMFQMGKKPGLSFESFSVGGADLSGKVLDKNGNQIGGAQYEYSTPLVYDAQYFWTWHDADWAIERFAKALKKSVK